MRVGVGVGAVMLGGCDAVAEAKARVLGDEAAATPTEAAATQAPAVEAAAPPAPEPLLLSRDGVGGVVEEVRAKVSLDRPAPTTVPSVEDLGRPRPEPEGSRAFVPYDGGVGALAVAPALPERTTAAPKPRPRARPKAVRPIESEPCDPIAPPEREWVCGPCGRG